MVRRGILGLTGGALVLTILALAYVFTDRGREVGDRLGGRINDRLDRLFPDEAGQGEGGGTEPEGTFEPEVSPDVEAAIASHGAPAPAPEPSGLPPPGGRGDLRAPAPPGTPKPRLARRGP